MALRKQELVKRLADRLGTTQAEAERTMMAVFGLVSDVVAEVGECKIHTFGMFRLKVMADKTINGKNVNGDPGPIHIPSYTRMTFRAAEKLADRMKKVKVPLKPSRKRK